jgi:predicted O-methyltransferase YrrM
MIDRDQLRRLIPSPVLRARRSIYRQFYLKQSLARLRSIGSVRTADEAWRVANEYTGFGEFETIRPSQRKSEVCSLIELLQTEKVRIACEIGSFLGGTLFMMTRVLPDNARIFSVDWPEAPASLGALPRARKPFHEGFARGNQQVRVIYGNSRDRATINALIAELDQDRLDFLMIDGDHSLEGVEADFQNYSPLVREGGLIAFHDIVAEDTERLYGYKFGADEVWQRIRTQYRATEFIDPETAELRNGGGIGVIWWNGS